jgi:HEAT repeat protein
MLMFLLVLGLAGQVACADVFEDLAGYKYGADPNVAEQALNAVIAAKNAEHAAIEQKLVAVISSAKATQAGKAWACRCLQLVGNDASVPALSALLQDEVLSDYARLALQRMVGSKAASAALLNALKKAPAKAQVGILASLGEIRASDAVKEISVLANSSDAAVAISAITALGKIGDSGSSNALLKIQPKEKTKQAYFDALIQSAGTKGNNAAASLYEKALASDSSQHRVAAMVGMVAVNSDKGIEILVAAIGGDDRKMRNGALTAAANIPGDKLTGALVKILGGLKGAAKAGLVEVLGARGDRAALAAILSSLGDEDKAVSAAAGRAVAKLGDAAAAKQLLGMAAGSKDNAELVKALTMIPGKEVDAVLVAALSNDQQRMVALAAVAERGVTDARPQLLKCLGDKNAAIQEAAWKAMGSMGGTDSIGPMMTALTGIKDEGMQSKALDAIGRAFSAEDDKGKAFELIRPEYDKSPLKAKQKIIELAAIAGTPNALECASAALKSGDEALYDSALRSLAGWQNGLAADKLLVLAESAPSEKQRIIALRGVVNTANARHVNLKDERRVELLQRASKLAKRPDEKRQIIGALQQRGTEASLAVLLGYLSDKEVFKDAGNALVSAADRAQRHHKEASVKALDTLIQKLEAPGSDANLKKRATDLRKRIQPK